MSNAVLKWRHAFKLDPERVVSDEVLERLCLSGSDGIIVGGSSGVTYANTEDLLSRIRRFDMPCVLEVSELEAVVPGFDTYLIPMVLNTRNIDWLIGRHREAVQRFGAIMPWDKIVAEGYIILNPASTAFRAAEAYLPEREDEIYALTEVADRLLHLPMIYIEYSGTFGDMALVHGIHARCAHARLVYGGGIDGSARAADAARAADLIVVGNLIYDNVEQALATVHGVNDQRR